MCESDISPVLKNRGCLTQHLLNANYVLSSEQRLVRYGLLSKSLYSGGYMYISYKNIKLNIQCYDKYFP